MTTLREGLRVAVVGCGRMGAERALRASSLGASVAECVDLDLNRATALASSYPGARATGDIDAIGWDHVDAVFVCTPPSLREAFVRRAVDARVPVMVEKPIGLSAAQGASLAQTVGAAGVINAVGYMNRYRDSVRNAKAFVAASRPSIVSCHWASKPYGVPWWTDASESGGPFNEQATHLVDLCRFVVGEVIEACAIAGKADGGRRLAAALRFENGAVGTLCYTCDAPDKHIAFEAITNAGAIRLEGWDFAVRGASESEEHNVFEKETRAFLEAVSANDQSTIASSFADAAQTQATVDLIRAATDA